MTDPNTPQADVQAVEPVAYQVRMSGDRWGKWGTIFHHPDKPLGDHRALVPADALATANAEIARLTTELAESRDDIDRALANAQASADLMVRMDERRLAAEAQRDVATQAAKDVGASFRLMKAERDAALAQVAAAILARGNSKENKKCLETDVAIGATMSGLHGSDAVVQDVDDSEKYITIQVGTTTWQGLLSEEPYLKGVGYVNAN